MMTAHLPKGNETPALVPYASQRLHHAFRGLDRVTPSLTSIKDFDRFGAESPAVFVRALLPLGRMS